MITFTVLGLLAAFGAGILSFLAPCVLPLVPSYLSYLAGASLQEGRPQVSFNVRVSFHALWFVVGFAILFTLLGAVTASFGLALSARPGSCWSASAGCCSSSLASCSLAGSRCPGCPDPTIFR